MTARCWSARSLPPATGSTCTRSRSADTAARGAPLLLCLSGLAAQTTLLRCPIDSNYCTGTGGGIWARTNLSGGAVGARVVGSLVQFNRAVHGGGVAAETNTSIGFEL